MGKSLSKSRFIEMFGNVATNNKRWEKTKLGNKSVIGSSKRIFANEYTTEGIPFYRSKEIIELGMGEKPSVELYISKKRYQEIKEKFGIPIPGDILMTAVGTIGKFWIVPNSKPFYYKDGNLVYIRTKEFNPLFLKKLLEMLIEKYKVENANGSAYTALTIEKLKDLQIVLPPMTLQKQYEEFYIQIDKLKFILQKMIEKLELLKKSRFIELFGTVNDNVHKYEVCSLGELVDINIGLTHTPKYTETGIPFLSVKDISSGKIDLSNVKFISKEEFNSLPKGAKPQPGDLLFCRVGTLGKPVIVSNEIGDFGTFVSLGYLRFSSDSKVIQNTIKCWMNSDLFDIQVRASISGASQPNLNTGWLKKFKLVVPPIEIQNEFANFVNQIDKSKLILQKQLEDLVGETK